MTGLRVAIAAAPPIADARELTIVTPICTVARNLSGSFLRRATAAADLTPFSNRAWMRDLRVAIMAISDAAKKPFARIKTNMNAASNQTLSRFIGRLPFLFGFADQRKRRRYFQR